MMKITATAAIPYAVVVSIPPDPAAVTVVTDVVVAGCLETVTLVVTVLVVAGGTFWRVSATRSPGIPVPQETSPAVIGTMTSMVPAAVAPIDAWTFSGPPM